jgi:hypothetical protein
VQSTVRLQDANANRSEWMNVSSPGNLDRSKKSHELDVNILFSVVGDLGPTD